jgi:hypothetical protein
MGIWGMCHATLSYLSLIQSGLSININEFAEVGIDPPKPFRYECHVYHMHLDVLDRLADFSFEPGSPEYLEHVQTFGAPFWHTCAITSGREIHSLSLDDCLGDPHLTCVRGDDTIIFQGLNSNTSRFCTISPLAGLQDFVRSAPYFVVWVLI